LIIPERYPALDPIHRIVEFGEMAFVG